MSETLRSKIEKSNRARLIEPREGAATVTFIPKTGRRRKTSDRTARRDS